ncbi:hypothetical protein [Paraconexibacter sp.]|uniref:hypothetical protein n=1 Tax=Paraconexibacter sp. TaxID=2949640 RepID=UPI0035695C03
MPRKVLLVLGLLLVLAAPAPAHALSPSVTVGIGDQKPGMFFDERFTKLGIADARIVVPWDWRTIRWQAGEVDAWMKAAQRFGVRTLVTFSHSRGKGRRRVLPKPERFKLEFRKFRRKYPWAKTFTVWNEANHCGEPTCRRPKLIAAYYRKLRQACKHCTLIPAELLDTPNMVRYARDVRRAMRFEPKIWGLHNYVDVNRRSTRRTRQLLRAVKGRIWLTETGGIVKRRNRRKETIGFREGTKHAARVTRFVFRDVVGLSSRIQRVYLYHWDTNTSGPKDSWDSALIGPRGPRPAFSVLKWTLKRQRVLRARARGG